MTLVDRFTSASNKCMSENKKNRCEKEEVVDLDAYREAKFFHQEIMEKLHPGKATFNEIYEFTKSDYFEPSAQQK
jgi:hypothetical protein